MKPILLVLDKSRVSNATAYKLSNVLYGEGFKAILLTVARRDEDKPLELFNLADLPPADIEEIRRIAKESGIA